MTALPDNLPRLILASGSPRRRDLLAEMGAAFEVIPPPLDEPADHPANISARAYAAGLANFKARSVAERHPGRWILGADTVVAQGGRIFGKPTDADDARAMLRALSHAPHEVVTGMALLLPGRRLIESDTTRVFMRPMSPADIEQYIATGEWQGKAGAYAIQETADRYVERIEGSFSNVVGLAVERLARMLTRAAG